MPALRVASENQRLGDGAVQFSPGTGNAVQTQFRRVLHLNVGCGRRYGYAEVAEAAEVSERTLRYYGEDGGKEPTLAVGLKVLALLGPAAMASVLAEVGYTARPAECQPRSPFDTLGSMGRGIAALSTALADGRIDHVERAGVIAMARELARDLEALAATLDGKTA